MTRIEGNATPLPTTVTDPEVENLPQPLKGDALVAKVLQVVVALREQAQAQAHGSHSDTMPGELLQAQRRQFESRLLDRAPPPATVPQQVTPQAAPQITPQQPAAPQATPQQPAAPMLWTDYALHATHMAASRQGALTPAQSQLSAAISSRLVEQASGGDPARLMAMRPQDFASLAQLAGVRPGLLSQPQLQAATHFINTATSAAHQQDRLNLSLNALQATQNLSEPPRLTVQEMKDQLRSTLGLGERAFKSMDPSQIQARYVEVLAALQQPGQHAVKFGSDTVRFGVDDNGQLGQVSYTRRGLFFDRTATLREQAVATAPAVASQAVAQPAPPQPSVQEMKDELRSMFGLKNKAFKKMSDDDIRAKYAEVMSAMQTPGAHKLQIGKYKVSFEVDASGQVSNLKCKKKGILGTILKGVLTVCSFIPIPWIAIPARIISAAIAVVEAAKAKSLLGVVAGVASAVAGGAGALAGTALSAAAKTVGTVASTVAKVARGVEAGVNAVKNKDVMGVVSAAASVAGSAAGALAKGAEAVANTAQKVSDWSQRALVGAKVVVDIKQGRVMDAVAGGASLAGSIAGDLKTADGQLKPFAEQVRIATDKVQSYAGYAQSAIGVAKGVANGDIAGAIAQGASLADQIDADVVAPGEDGDPARVTVGQVLGHVSSGINVVQQFGQSNVQGGLEQTSTLFENLTPLVSPNSGWSEGVQRLLDNGVDVAGMVEDIREGRLQSVFDKGPGVIGSLGWNLTDAGLLKLDDRGQPPKAVQTVQQWAGHIRDGYTLVDDIRHGDTGAAVSQGVALFNGVSDAVSSGPGLQLDPDAGWAESAQRVVDAATQAPALARLVRSGDVEGVLDRAAWITTHAGEGIADLIAPQNNAMPVLQDIALWMGRGADAWHAVNQIRSGDYKGATYQVLDVTTDLLPEPNGERVRERAIPAIYAADELQRAIAGRDAVRSVVEAAQFIESLRRALAKANVDSAEQLATAN